MQTCFRFSDTITALCVIFFVSIQLLQIFNDVSLFSKLSLMTIPNLVFLCFHQLFSLIVFVIIRFLKDALLQHVKRSIYEAGIWATSDDQQLNIPSPDRFGWKKEDGCWVPVWLTLPEVSRSCRELVKCSCKTQCSRCKCAKASLPCTDLCKCKCSK